MTYNIVFVKLDLPYFLIAAVIIFPDPK